jgi:hypothetical protein
MVTGLWRSNQEKTCHEVSPQRWPYRVVAPHLTSHHIGFSVIFRYPFYGFFLRWDRCSLAGSTFGCAGLLLMQIKGDEHCFCFGIGPGGPLSTTLMEWSILSNWAVCLPAWNGHFNIILKPLITSNKVQLPDA